MQLLWDFIRRTFYLSVFIIPIPIGSYTIHNGSSAMVALVSYIVLSICMPMFYLRSNKSGFGENHDVRISPLAYFLGYALVQIVTLALFNNLDLIYLWTLPTIVRDIVFMIVMYLQVLGAVGIGYLFGNCKTLKSIGQMTMLCALISAPIPAFFSAWLADKYYVGHIMFFLLAHATPLLFCKNRKLGQKINSELELKGVLYSAYAMYWFWAGGLSLLQLKSFSVLLLTIGLFLVFSIYQFVAIAIGVFATKYFAHADTKIPYIRTWLYVIAMTIPGKFFFEMMVLFMSKYESSFPFFNGRFMIIWQRALHTAVGLMAMGWLIGRDIARNVRENNERNRRLNRRYGLLKDILLFYILNIIVIICITELWIIEGISGLLSASVDGLGSLIMYLGVHSEFLFWTRVIIVELFGQPVVLLMLLGIYYGQMAFAKRIDRKFGNR